jgi:DNA (cytosine-5)-methyltransferase 1
MKVLDLCCGAGGCSMGYDWAGFNVVGVDEAPQKHYPFEFIQDDALNYLLCEDLSEFDFIHASPPCQAYSKVCQVHRNNGKVYPDIIKQIRSLLVRSDKPFVIENVEGAPLYRPVMLCGTMFDLKVLRHRLFESNFYIKSPGRCNHNGTVKDGDYFTVCGNGSGKNRDNVKNWSDAMDIHWMTRDELTQAIPPAYTRYIGECFKTWVENGGSNRLFGYQ